MTFSCAVPSGLANWSSNWAWGLPLIVLNLILHVFGLLVISERAERIHNGLAREYRFALVFAVIVGGVALTATLLHGVEAVIWASAYRLVGALPDNSSAMLYSLSAITSYGHANLDLAKHWQVMGALEALNGMVLFGLTTAFLFGVIQRVWGLRGSTSR